jgi:HPt (histidine-containing phosphotransfer) domain-containing protein
MPDTYNSAGLFDEEIIKSLKELGGEEGDNFFKEIIEIYLQQAPSLMDDIKSSASKLDFVKLDQSAHALKGASLNIGAKLFANICKMLEFKGKEKDGNNLGELLIDLENIYVKTEIELKRMI